MQLFTKVLIGVGTVSVAGLVIYNIKQHRDNLEIIQSVGEVMEAVQNLNVDLAFYDIVERYEE